MRRGLPLGGLSLTRRRAQALLALPMVMACSRSPEPADLEKSARSWGATSQLVVDRWEHGAVSRKFAALALDRASFELVSVEREAAQLPDTSRDRVRVATLVHTIRGAVTAADSAAERDDRAGAVAAVLRLDRDHTRSAALARVPAPPK